MKVKGICAKADFAKTKLMDSGLLVVRYDETENEDGTVSYSEESVANTIDSVRELWKRRIDEYDTSGKVNAFTLKHGDVAIEYWLPAAKRVQLLTAANAVKATGGKEYVLDIREKGVSISVDCDKLISMLTNLEDYAAKCYNATSRHLADVDRLTTIEEVVGYDITEGYPETPTFEV